MIYFKDLNNVFLARNKNPNIPIWQIVSNDLTKPSLQLNTKVPVGVRNGYKPQVCQATFDDIYDLIINNKEEITILEHHLEPEANKLNNNEKYWHKEVKVNKNIIDPLTFTIDLDIFELDLQNKKVENKVIDVINKIIFVLTKKNINISIKDFIVLTSPFDNYKKKYSFHIILRAKNILCKNQWSFLSLLKEVKEDNKSIDKMFPGMITRIYKTGKFPMNQSSGRLFKCWNNKNTLTLKDFKDEREFFKNTLMYYNNYNLKNTTLI